MAKKESIERELNERYQELIVQLVKALDDLVPYVAYQSGENDQGEDLLLQTTDVLIAARDAGFDSKNGKFYSEIAA